MMNENAVANIVTDITFLENEITRIGREHLKSSFLELHSVRFPRLRLVVLFIGHVDGQHCSLRFGAGLS
jgi:hypothetical protein